MCIARRRRDVVVFVVLGVVLAVVFVVAVVVIGVVAVADGIVDVGSVVVVFAASSWSSP